MGIEWFRDLSITILGFLTVAMLILLGVVIFSLYRKIAATLFKTQTLIESATGIADTIDETIKSTSQSISDTITEVKDSVRQVSKGIDTTFTRIQDRIKPLLPVLALIQGISEGIKSIKELFKKENNKGGNCNE